MRFSLPLALALLAAPLCAEEFTLQSQVSRAELYPDGATLWRDVAFDLPAGQHRIVIPDLPLSVPLGQVRIAAEGLEISAVSGRVAALPPREMPQTQEVLALQEDVARLEAEARDLADAMAGAESALRAAEAEVAALEGLDLSQVAGQSPRSLAELSRDLRDSLSAALTARDEAARAVRPFAEQQEALEEALENARKALAAALPDETERGRLSIEVSAAAAMSGTLEVSYFTTEASWQPLHDLRLDREAGQVRLRRAATLQQRTDEVWRDVRLALSTARPHAQTAPSELWPLLRRVEPPAPALEMARVAAAPMVGKAAYDTSAQVMDGLRTRYDLPQPITLAPAIEDMQVTLREALLPAEIFARAVPARDETAFVAAQFENVTGQPLLPAPANLYLDGAFMGQRFVEGIATGGKAEISFGPIEGLRLRAERRAMEGERGLLSSRNEREDRVVYVMNNQTGAHWDLRVLAQVPYSEQDDLTVTWDAEPVPFARDVAGRQGVHEWRIGLAGGAEARIAVETRLRWPEGLELR